MRAVRSSCPRCGATTASRDCADGTCPEVRGPVDLTALLVQPVPEVVTLLEDMLERARSGEVQGIAIAAACTGHCNGNAYALGTSDIATLNLAVDYVKARLLSHSE